MCENYNNHPYGCAGQYLVLIIFKISYAQKKKFLS